MKKKNKTIILILILCLTCAANTKFLGAKGDAYKPNQDIIAKEKELGYEVPPVLSAKNLVPAKLLSSKNHVVLDAVYNDGFYNHYTIKTTWGYFYAGGDEKLKTRVNEIYAIDALKQVENDDVLINSAKEGGKKILMAPVNAVKSVGNAIMNPEDTLKKVESIPSGVTDFFSGIARKIKGEANHISNQVDKIQKNDRAQGKEETSTAQIVVEKSGKRIFDEGLSYAKRWIGYNKNVREIEKQFGILPDTDNELLKDEITRIAGLKTGVMVSTKFVPGIPMFQVISEANEKLGMINKISTYEDKIVQEEMVFNELLNVGLPENTIYKFQKQHYLTTSQKTIITNAIINLAGVQERASLISMALNLDNEEAGRIYTNIVTTLPYLNQKYQFKHFLTTTFLPVAITKDNKAVAPLVTNYIFWTDTLDTIINSALKKTNNEAKGFELILSGKISDRALKELNNKNIKIIYLENILQK